jgi:hypothetical protein
MLRTLRQKDWQGARMMGVPHWRESGDCGVPATASAVSPATEGASVVDDVGHANLSGKADREGKPTFVVEISLPSE